MSLFAVSVVRSGISVSSSALLGVINDFAALSTFVDLFEFASELFDLRVRSVLQSQGPIHWQDMVAGGMTEHDQTLTSIEFGGFRL